MRGLDLLRGLAILTAGMFLPAPGGGAESHDFLADRGPGVATSMFGTYVEHRELLLYAFYEYTLNRNQEYKPEELGFGDPHDYRARRADHEALVFFAYGLGPDLAIEGESALWTTATQEKSPLDPSAMPLRLRESGFGDTEGQVRWRFLHESERRPELFATFEAVAPLQRNRRLIGTQAWELSPGLAAAKGGLFGTWTAHVTASWTPEDGTFELGETSVEWLKRLTPRWRAVASIEGEQDEWALILEAQALLRPGLRLKVNNGFGLTDKAPDFAPEVGLLWSLGTRPPR